MDDPKHGEGLVLLVGTVDREGVLSAVKSAGLRYSVKRIDSTPKNWTTISGLFSKNKVTCALLKLTPTTYHYLASTQYGVVRDELLRNLANTRHAVYVYEDLFSGATLKTTDGPKPKDFGPDSNSEDLDIEYTGYKEFSQQQLSREQFADDYFCPPSPHVRTSVNALLSERGIEIVPYRSNAELTVLATKFIADADEGLLFRVYLPTDRIWAQETDRLLTLFRDYLGHVGHQNITLNQTRTSHGIVYEFFAAHPRRQNEPRALPDLSIQFHEFSQLLDLCLRDNEQASELLVKHGVASRDIAGLLSRYSKEAKRLQVDLRHEREQKTLSIRHRLEAELVDELPAQIGSGVLAQLVDAAIPPLSGLAAPLTAAPSSLQLVAAAGSNVVVNVRPQIVSAINSMVAQEVNGGVHLTNEDNQILQLIRAHAPDRAMELESAIRQVADDSVAKPDRLLSARKIKGFLIQLATKIPDVGAALLQAYIEKRLGLS